MRVSYLAVSEKRCTIQIAGCNFRCRGCFSNEKEECGVEMTGSQLAKYIPAYKEVMLAGGEPAIDRQGLLSLVAELKKEPNKRKIILSTQAVPKTIFDTIISSMNFNNRSKDLFF